MSQASKFLPRSRLAVVSIVVGLAGCDQARPNKPEPSRHTEFEQARTVMAAAMLRSEVELTRRRAALQEQLSGQAGRAQGEVAVALSWLESARLARVLSYKGAVGVDLDTIAAAYEAAARAAPTGSPVNCEVMLEWAEFESTRASNPDPVVALAERARRGPGNADCMERARWIVATLDRETGGMPPALPDNAPLEAPTELTKLSVADWGVEGVRVSLQLSKLAEFQTEQQRESGERNLTMKLAHTILGEEVPRNLRVGRAGLVDVALQTFPDGRLEARFVLEEDAVHHTFFLTEPFRLVFDVTPPRAASRGAQEKVRVVVLDPGHGGDDLGAESEGLTESALTLDLARRAVTYLEEWLPEVRVVLTRRRNEAVSLEDRVAFANRVSADVFVSVHLNGWDEQLSHGGVTTFVLDSTDDQNILKLAARENGTSVGQVSSMQRLLAGLLRDKQGPESLALANLVHRSVVDAGRSELRTLPDRGVKSAMFYVLVGARMPAILLEASFLTQDDEREALRLSSYRDALAQGIARGVVAYAQRRERSAVVPF